MNIAQTLLGGLGSVLSGGTLGVIGSVATSIVDIFKTRETNKQQLAVIAAQKEMAIANGNSQAAIEMLKLVGGSYEQDKATYQSTALFSVDWFRGTFRPFICWALFGLSCWITYYALTITTLPNETWSQLAEYAVCLCLNLMATCIGWWFASRQQDKLTIRKK